MNQLKLILVSAVFYLLQLHSASAFFVSRDTVTMDDSSRVREYDFSVEYGTTRLYRGIKSSTHPYISPSFAYAASSGFFTGIESYISLDSGHIDETDLNAGYEFSLSKETEASIELIHYFFKNNQLANSLIRNGIELYLRHNFCTILKSKVYLDADFGKAATDYSITLDNSHEFVMEDVFAEDSKMTIKPSFSFTTGTLNLVRRLGKENVSTGFRLTNYDLSLSLEYEIGRFIIEPDAAYDFPVNGKQPVLQKVPKADPVFYFTASITYVID